MEPTLTEGSLLLDGYRIQDRILGGHGVVYRLENLDAKDLDARFSAAKTVGSADRTNDDVARVFLEECQTWLSVPRYDHCTWAFSFQKICDRPFVFMEWVAGGSLEQSLQKYLARTSEFVQALDHLGEDLERRRIYLKLGTLVGIARGVDHFHRHVAKVHCDLKPSNVLIEADISPKLHVLIDEVKDTDDGIHIPHMVPQGMVLARQHLWLTKVTDFGYNRSVGERSIGHTHGYAAPEQIQPDGTVDFRTDVYGFGRTAFFVLFDETPTSLGWVDPLCGTGSIDPNLLSLVKSCVELDPRNRPSGFDVVIEQLQSCTEAQFGLTIADPQPTSNSAEDLIEMISSDPKVVSDSVKFRSGAQVQAIGAAISRGDNLLTCSAPSAALGQYHQAMSSISDREEVREDMEAACRERIGLSQLQLGDTVGASSTFELGMFKEMSDQLGALSLRARGFLADQKMGDVGLARLYFRTAQCVDPADAEVCFSLAITERKFGNILQAEQEVRRAIDIALAGTLESNRRDVADYHRLRGDLLFEIGLAGDAIESLDAGIELDDSLPQLWRSKGRVLHAEQSLTKARECLRRAHDLEPTAESWYDLGVIIGSDGDFAEAANCYRSALKIDDSLENAWFNLGVMMNEEDNLEEAYVAFLRAGHAGHSRAPAALEELSHLITDPPECDLYISVGHFGGLPQIVEALASDLESMGFRVAIEATRESLYTSFDSLRIKSRLEKARYFLWLESTNTYSPQMEVISLGAKCFAGRDDRFLCGNLDRPSSKHDIDLQDYDSALDRLVAMLGDKGPGNADDDSNLNG